MTKQDEIVTEAMLPCPFWGHRLAKVCYDTEARAFRVVCQECGTCTGAGSRLAVVAAWNTRSTAQEPALDDDAGLRIVFDGPPGPEAGRFVECETADGRSINAGEWHERADGLWELRIDRLQAKAPETD